MVLPTVSMKTLLACALLALSALDSFAVISFTVISGSDSPSLTVSDTDTLRGAILAANASSDPVAVISIDIPGDEFNSVFPTIVLTGTLPPITKSVTITGPFTVTTPKIMPFCGISGAAIVGTLGAAGLELQGTNSKVSGLRLINFSNLTGDASALLLKGSKSTVTGCWIGTDFDPTNNAGNDIGVTIMANGCTIGGSGTSANVITGNGQAGIVVDGTSVSLTGTGNVIQGNFIGTLSGGDLPALFHGNDGIELIGARSAVIGGSTTALANTIAGHTGWGVYVVGGSANQVIGNFVGTATSGTVDLSLGGGANLFANGNYSTESGGIRAEGGTQTIISNNIISGNIGHGIHLLMNATATKITGNNIGVDSEKNALPNTGDGIHLGGTDSSTSNNLIGGAYLTTSGTSSPGNIISGNGGCGIFIESGSNDEILGNDIGIVETGTGNVRRGMYSNAVWDIPGGNATAGASTVVVANGSNGIYVTGTGELIGGTATGARNVISGNGAVSDSSGNYSYAFDGIYLEGSQGVKIIGNVIGLDASGRDLPEDSLYAWAGVGNGIHISVGQNPIPGGENQIGDSVPAARNIISGNPASGILLGSDSNKVLGNFIGANAYGEIVGNGSNGITIASGSNIIGMGTATSSSVSNIIVGNGGDGIRLDLFASGNKVNGNWIGVCFDDSQTLRSGSMTVNTGNGVGIYLGSSSNVIGGLAADNQGANIIGSGTGYAGVRVFDVNAISNTIHANAFELLGGAFPIYLDSGNGLVQPPTLSPIVFSGSQFVLSGTYPGGTSYLSPVSLDVYRVDPMSFFPSLYQYVESVSVDPSLPVAISLAGKKYGGNTFAVALTDGAGNTSGFSNDAVAPTLFDFSLAGLAMATGTDGIPVITVHRTDGSLPLNIVRYGDPSQSGTVQLTMQDIDLGGDFVNRSGACIFSAGNNSTGVTIPIVNDPAAQGAHSFLVTMSSSTGTILTPTVKVSVIATPVTPQPTPTQTPVPPAVPKKVWVTADTPFVDEGTVGSVWFTIQRTGDLTNPASVTFSTLDGSAISGKNYIGKTGVVVISPGQSSVRVEVPLLKKSLKTNVTFTFRLIGSSDSALSSPSSVVETVCNLHNQHGTLEFSSATFLANETGPTAIVTVKRKGGTDGTVSASYSTANGSAIGGINYAPVANRVMLRNGQKTATFQIPVFDDHIATPDKQFFVGLVGTTGGATLGAARIASVSLIDCDGPSGVFQFERSAITARKGARNLAINVVRIGGNSGSATLAYTFKNGSAKSGSQFVGQNGLLTFGNGFTIMPISVPLKPSGGSHPAQTFTISLGNPNLGRLGFQNTVTVTIPAQ